MEFQIEKSEFIRGLRLASSIADRKSTMPILANVLLRTNKNNRLAVVATNLLCSIVIELDAKIEGEGAITVGAKSLHEIVSGLPGDAVKFSVAENGFAVVTSKKSSYKLVGMGASDFPKVPDWQGVEYGKVDPKVMVSMIDKVMPAISTDESRAHLAGCLYESDGENSVMVSTDGHRLAKIVESTMGSPKLKNGIIIPRKGLSEIKHVLESANGPVDVGFKDSLFIKSGAVVLSIKPIDAQFPPYNEVVPKNNPNHASVDRREFFEALKRTSLMVSRDGGVKVSLEKDIMQVSGDNPERGEAHETLDLEYPGKPMAVSFNAKYMLEFLGEMSAEKVSLELDSETDPVVIRPAGDNSYLCIIMPMRI